MAAAPDITISLTCRHTVLNHRGNLRGGVAAPGSGVARVVGGRAGLRLASSLATVNRGRVEASYLYVMARSRADERPQEKGGTKRLN